MNLAGGIGFLRVCTPSPCSSARCLLSFCSRLGIPRACGAAGNGACVRGHHEVAQMPFHTGCSAPHGTHLRALLHSSTMVKGWRFFVSSLAPIFRGVPGSRGHDHPGGGRFDVAVQLMAISQSNAKRVLAYSTIANLGLVGLRWRWHARRPSGRRRSWKGAVPCRGEKPVVPGCVGSRASHRQPQHRGHGPAVRAHAAFARFMMAGIMVMFVAPFGMLIAKWGTLVNRRHRQHRSSSSWASARLQTFCSGRSGLGKLSGIAAHPLNVETTVHRSEWIGAMLMAVLYLLCCAGLPGHQLVRGRSLTSPARTGTYQQTVSDANPWVGAILSVVVFVVLFAGLGAKQVKQAPIPVGHQREQRESHVHELAFGRNRGNGARNWYLEGIFGEAKPHARHRCCTLIIIIAFAAALCAPCGII